MRRVGWTMTDRGDGDGDGDGRLVEMTILYFKMHFMNWYEVRKEKKGDDVMNAFRKKNSSFKIKISVTRGWVEEIKT